MGTIEKTWILYYGHLRLLARDRAILLVLLIVPVAGSLAFGVCRGSLPLSAVGLFVVMAATSTLLAPRMRSAVSILPPAGAEPAIRTAACASSLLAALLVFAVQSVIYASVSAAAALPLPTVPVFALVLGLALLVHAACSLLKTGH